MLGVNAEEVQTDDGAEEAGERLLRASQGLLIQSEPGVLTQR